MEIARAEVDERIELLPPGELGEIVIRGHNVFAGYLGGPRRPRRRWSTAGSAPATWARKDADGFITIVDRKKDLIIRGGFNVYPREVEEVLARHPAVGQVAVIGVPDPRHGEEICAVVVADPAGPGLPDEQEMIDWSREHLGRHKYPRQVRFVDALPLGPEPQGAQAGTASPDGPARLTTARRPLPPAQAAALVALAAHRGPLPPAVAPASVARRRARRAVPAVASNTER